MSKSGIVNVRMVLTEEKVLSNIDKIQKLINPNSKKKIVELEENSYFKELIESVKNYITEYPKKKSFPADVYKSAYGLVEFATKQFEENTKRVEKLIKQREENIALAGTLKEALQATENREDGWKEKIEDISDKFDEDIINNLNKIGRLKSKTTQTYIETKKALNVKINNLEANLHIEIDMERLEDSSRALSYIGIEIAEALKELPVPEEQIEAIIAENEVEENVTENVQEKVVNEIIKDVETETKEDVAAIKEKVEDKKETIQKVEETPTVEEFTEEQFKEEQKQYMEQTTFETKKSLWQKIKDSKIVRAATYIFRIKIRIELPSNALPEGRGEN